MASALSSFLIRRMSSELFRLPPLILPPSTSAMVDPFVPPPAPRSLPNVPFRGGALELMAVPKKKVSRHKRGIRNGPRALKPVPVIVRCRSCGRVKLPHFYCCSGDRGSSGDTSA